MRSLAMLLLGLVLPCALPATIYVDGTNGNDSWNGLCETWDGGTCGPKKTIGAGLAAAASGDEVIIADGTYRLSEQGSLRVVDKTLTLRSTHGADATIIDCEYYQPSDRSAALQIEQQRIDTASATVIGLGFAHVAGVTMYIIVADVTIADCHVDDAIGGIGVGARNSISITGCEINDVWAGTAIWTTSTYRPDITVQNCRVVNVGTGLSTNVGETTTISDCRFDQCFVGVYLGLNYDFTSCALQRCEITNSSDVGLEVIGYFWVRGAFVVADCLFEANVGRGAVHVEGTSDASFASCSFSDNHAVFDQPGMYTGGAIGLRDCKEVHVVDSHFVDIWLCTLL